MTYNQKSQICEEAELYYLSLAFGGEYGDAPEQIVSHVESCGYCQTQLKALKDHLLTAGTADSDNSQLPEAQIHMLGLHLAHLGKEVGCEVVKPFLPSLLEPSLKVAIPTPITVHLDRCELCRRDLAAIEAMGLSGKQLNVLNSTLSDDSSLQNVDCSVAASAVRQYVDLDFRTVEPEVVRHLCCCKVCQALIYKARAEKIKGLREKNAQTVFPCESVTFSDVFDYCFPYGLVPCSDQYAGFREPFINELKQCARCLQKVQDLHQQVYAIKQRPESGIVTVYEIGELPKSEVAREADSNYSGFPVSVRAVEPADQQILLNVRQKHTVSPGIASRAWKVASKHLVKAAVAAAVILAVALFVRSMPTATAVTIQQVYDAIQKAVNVHIQQFVAESPEPLQEKWVSKDLGIYAVKDKNGFMIWDITDKVKHGKLTGSQQSEVVPLSEEQSAAIQKRIQGSLGIMPFENVLQVPKDAEWQELDSSTLQDITTNVFVYELLWTKQSTDRSVVRFKWLGFIEEATNRPLRTEFYRCDSNSGEYELQTVHLIEYWTEDQIKELLP